MVTADCLAGMVTLSQLAIAELRLWCKCIWKLRGTRLRRQLEKIGFVDASRAGYGAVWARVAANAAGGRGLRVEVRSALDMREYGLSTFVPI